MAAHHADKQQPGGDTSRRASLLTSIRGVSLLPDVCEAIVCYLVEPFEYEGIFWSADHSDRKVAGRLRYQPTEGSSLSLLGSFEDDPARAFSFVDQITPRRIIGAADGKELTLDGCLVKNVRFDGTGMLRQTYYVPVVLEGIQFSVDEALEFDTLTIGFDQLPSWLGYNPFNLAIDSTTPNDLASATKFTLACEIPSRTEERGPDLGVELGYETSISGNRLVEMTLARQPRLSINYNHRHPLVDIVTDVNGLQDLITLAVDIPTVPTSIQLQRSNLTITTRSRKNVEFPIEAYWYNIAEHVRHDQPANTSIFGFDQVGGLQTLYKWIQVSRRYRTAVGTLLTIRYAERLTEENRLSNVVGAAETFHRIKYADTTIMPTTQYRSFRRKVVRVVKSTMGANSGNWLNTQLIYSNEPRLRQRLTALADYAGEGFTSLVGDVESWVRVATWLRNRLTHHDPRQQLQRMLPDMHEITESVFILVMFVLLRECDFPDEVFNNMTNVPRIALLRDHLAEIVPRLKQQLHG